MVYVLVATGDIRRNHPVRGLVPQRETVEFDARAGFCWLEVLGQAEHLSVLLESSLNFQRQRLEQHTGICRKISYRSRPGSVTLCEDNFGRSELNAMSEPRDERCDVPLPGSGCGLLTDRRR